MLEILQYYTSDFWIWLGITIGMGAMGTAIAYAIRGRKDV